MTLVHGNGRDLIVTNNNECLRVLCNYQLFHDAAKWQNLLLGHDHGTGAHVHDLQHLSIISANVENIYCQI